MNKLVILACSQRKIWYKTANKKIIAKFPNINFLNRIIEDKERQIEAKYAYTGDVFTYGRIYCEKNNFPYKILSAEYGIIDSDFPIKSYNKKLKNKKEVESIINKEKAKIEAFFKEYDNIFMIGGNSYYRLIFKVFDKEGKFSYLPSFNQGDLKNKAKALLE